MLVIHWAKQNKTNSILANGIRPASRKDKETGEPKNSKGVYVYPFSRNKTLRGNWRRNLKTWDTSLGNFNGCVFRLGAEDFPLLAGDWFFNRQKYDRTEIKSLQELTELYGDFFSGEIVNKTEDGIPYDWEDFEIILPYHIEARRILKVIKDREPKRKSKGKLTSKSTTAKGGSFFFALEDAPLPAYLRVSDFCCFIFAASAAATAACVARTFVCK